MSSHEEEIAEMKADIKALEAERRAATAPERKDRLLDAITAMRNQLIELMRAAAPAQAAPAPGVTREDFDAFSYALSSKLDVMIPFVSKINARLNNPWTPSKVSGTRDDCFRNNLKTYRGFTSNKIPCMLTGQVGNGEQICAAHILPCSTAKDIVLDLGMTLGDLNSPRNGLFLSKNVEIEFDLLRLSFVPKDVLHPNLLKMVIWSEESREKFIWDGHEHRIGQYEGCTLTLAGHDPFRRALSFQAYQAHEHARRPPEDRHREFGTPPSNFIKMRLLLEANYETSYREEVLLSSDGDEDEDA